MSNNPKYSPEEFVVQMDGGVYITMVVDGDNLFYCIA